MLPLIHKENLCVCKKQSLENEELWGPAEHTALAASPVRYLKVRRVN